MIFDYGILNISGPEGVVILAVGWYLLGPTELYKLAKSVGAVIGNLSSLAKNAASQFVDSMENEIVAQDLGLSQPGSRPVQNFFEKAFQDGVNEAEQVMPSMLDPAGQATPAPAAADAAPGTFAKADPEAIGQEKMVDDEGPEAQKFQSQLDADAWNRSIMEQDPAALAADVPEELSAADHEEATALSEDEAFAKLDLIRSLEEERAQAVAQLEEDFLRKRERLEAEMSGKQSSEAPTKEA